MEIRVKSATYAMQGKQLLHRSGIRAHVGKRSGENGCFYYLSVAEKYAEKASHILEMAQIIK